MTLATGGAPGDAERLLDTLDDECRELVEAAISTARGAAATALSAAELLDARLMVDGLTDAERAELVAAYSLVLVHDHADEGASKRLASLDSSTTSTTTTSTTLPLNDQIRELLDLGLIDKAKEKVNDAIATGTLDPALRERIDASPSLDDRATKLRDTWLDWLIPVGLGAAIIAVMIVLRWFGRYATDGESARLAIAAAPGDTGAAFSAAVRSTLSRYDEWSGTRVGYLDSSVPTLPSVAELNDSLKPVDWFLKKVWNRNWRVVQPTLHPADGNGASVTLELTRVRPRNRVTLRTEPAGFEPDKDSHALLVPMAAAWTMAHWDDKRKPKPTDVAWDSNAANLAGIEHLDRSRVDEALLCFGLAVERDPRNLVAQQNLLLTLSRKFADDPTMLIQLAMAYDKLVDACEMAP